MRRGYRAASTAGDEMDFADAHCENAMVDALAGLPVLAEYSGGGFGVVRLGALRAARLTAPARIENVITVCWAPSDRVVQRRLGESYTSTTKVGNSFLMPSGVESMWEGNIPPSVRLSLEPEVLARAATELGASRRAALPNLFEVNDPVLFDIARIAAREVLDPNSAGHRLIADGLSTVLATHLLTRYRAIGSSAPSSAASTAVERVIIAIHERFSEDLSLQELADVARVSRFHLARVFRLHTGSTVIGYLRSVRLAEARRLLLDDSMSVAGVAQSVGLSTAHLIRLFRESTGTTPAAWARSRR